MYERSAIVLERYIEKILQLNKDYNLKENLKNYIELIQEIEEYEIITTKEGKIIEEFDYMAQKIESLQKEQEKLYQANIKLEENRNKLFGDLGENSTTLERNFIKIENSIDKNNEELKNLREEFINYLTDFAQRQKERNKCEKDRRLGEAKHIQYIKDIADQFKKIDGKDLLNLKDFINSDKETLKKDLSEAMLKNGKSEKVGFNKDVIKLAVKTRLNVAEKEAECYIVIYDKMRKILSEIENEDLKLNKYKKVLKGVSVKLAFLEAEKEYIVSFLDYERMTVISGVKIHNKMMEEACSNFQLDITQINNLYELILREVSNKSTKKAYKELYNKTYLKNIEDKEKNFEQEVNNIKINMGTVINSNYWRIEGIKNIYNVFQNEVAEKFEKDLSEYKIDEFDNVDAINDLLDEATDFAKTEQIDELFDNMDNRKYKEYEDNNYEDDEEYEYDEEDNYYDEDEGEEDDDYDEDNEYDYDEDEEDDYDEDNEDEEAYIIVEKARKASIKKINDKKEGIFNKIFREKKKKDNNNKKNKINKKYSNK